MMNTVIQIDRMTKKKSTDIFFNELSKSFLSFYRHSRRIEQKKNPNFLKQAQNGQKQFKRQNTVENERN